MKKTIGINVEQPKNTCDDRNCPFHGSIGVRGRTFTGVVVSDKASKTVTVEWQRTIKVPKYGHLEKKKSKAHAHNPPCINAKSGQFVKIAETRPISKTKNFVIVEVLK
ncbi:MAG: 30S ribosomal protein S17 [Candidatus Woesearchaeota archaeon]